MPNQDLINLLEGMHIEDTAIMMRETRNNYITIKNNLSNAMSLLGQKYLDAEFDIENPTEG